MEILRPDLLIYFTFLACISCSIPYLLKPLTKLAASLLRSGGADDEREARAEARRLRAEQAALSAKEHFAAHARLQRRINAAEDRARELGAARSGREAKVRFALAAGAHALVALVVLASSWAHRRTPLVALNRSQDPLPLGALLAFPSDEPVIAPHAWLIVSRVAASTAVAGAERLLRLRRDVAKRDSLYAQ